MAPSRQELGRKRLAAPPIVVVHSGSEWGHSAARTDRMIGRTRGNPSPCARKTVVAPPAGRAVRKPSPPPAMVAGFSCGSDRAIRPVGLPERQPPSRRRPGSSGPSSARNRAAHPGGGDGVCQSCELQQPGTRSYLANREVGDVADPRHEPGSELRATVRGAGCAPMRLGKSGAWLTLRDRASEMRSRNDVSRRHVPRQRFT